MRSSEARAATRRAVSIAVSLTVATPTLFATGAADASDAEVTSDTAAQFYDVRSPSGGVVLQRRRVTSTLGLGVYDLLGNHETPQAHGHTEPDLLFRARLRYDADYGANSAQANPDDFARLVPGFDRSPIDLMYGYVEGRRFVHGTLGFKLGRQFVTDALGWWSFDGGEVRVTTPLFVAVEAYGGLEVRGGLPLSTSRFESGGIWRGNRDGYDPTLYPAFQSATVAPAFGAAIESAGVPWLHARLTYRRVLNTGVSNTTFFSSGTVTPVSYDGARISQERVGYSIDANAWNVGGARAGIAYDMYLARIANVYASVDVFATKKLTLSADYDYFQPSFDADSIFNFFATEPTNDLGLRASFDASSHVAVSGGAHVRAFGQRTQAINTTMSPNVASPDANYYPSNGMAFNEGFNVAGRYTWGGGNVGVRGAGDFGSGGQRVGADVFGERVLETRYVLSGRGSLWQWDDKLRPGRDAVSVGYVAGLGYKFAERSQTRFEFEHTLNRVSGQRFRVMLWLTVAVAQ